MHSFAINLWTEVKVRQLLFGSEWGMMVVRVAWVAQWLKFCCFAVFLSCFLPKNKLTKSWKINHRPIWVKFNSLKNMLCLISLFGKHVTGYLRWFQQVRRMCICRKIYGICDYVFKYHKKESIYNAFGGKSE